MQTQKTLSYVNKVRLILVLSTIEILNRLKNYMEDIDAKKGLEEELANYKEAIEQTFITLDAAYNFKTKENAEEFLLNKNVQKAIDAVNILIFQIKQLVNHSEKLKKDFDQVLINKYKKEKVINERTIAHLFQNRIIDEKETRAILDEKVKNEIIDLYFANLIITNNQLCEIFQNGAQKSIDLLYDGKIDKELFKKLIGLTSSQIFKLNQEDIITDEILFEFLSSEEMLEMHKKNGSIKFLTKIPKKDLIKFFFEDKINIEDLIKSNLDICEAFKSESEKITKEEFMQFYESIQKDEKIKEETKTQVLPKEKDIIQLYEETILLNGQDILKIYNLQGISLNGIIKIYSEQYKEEPDIIEIEDIEKIFTADKIYELYKSGELNNEISAFYIMNIKQELKEIISSEITAKVQAEEKCALCGMELFKKGILLLKDIEQNGLVNESDWINSYENQLDKNKVEKQNIVEDLIKSYQEGLISSEAVSVLIEDFQLQEDILKMCDGNKISAENFNKISEMFFTKDYFIKTYENETFKTKQPIIMAYNANMLSDEDFKNLYHEGIILEDEIFDLAKQGFLSEEKIIILYTSCMLSEDKLNDLFISGKISEENKQKAIEELDIKKVLDGLEPFLGKIDNIYAIEDDIEEEENYNSEDDIPEINIPVKKMLYVPRYRNQVDGPTNHKYIEITLPIAREKLFVDKYKAIKIPSRKINMPRGSSFENYEFYLLLEQDGITKSDSIIIGERYYEDKFEEYDYNLVGNNATYLFTVKDLMRLFNKSDDEREKIAKTGCDKNIIKINHNIDPKLKKTWAERLGKAVAKMKGHRNLESIYMPEEMQKIKEWEEQIDTKKRYTVDIHSK